MDVDTGNPIGADSDLGTPQRSIRPRLSNDCPEEETIPPTNGEQVSQTTQRANDYENPSFGLSRKLHVATISSNFDMDTFLAIVAPLSRSTITSCPHSLINRMLKITNIALEGALAGDRAWGALCEYRSRLLLAPVRGKVQGISPEVDARMKLWETHHFIDLAERIAKQLGDSTEVRPRVRSDAKQAARLDPNHARCLNQARAGNRGKAI